jgi:hypothetical protein
MRKPEDIVARLRQLNPLLGYAIARWLVIDGHEERPDVDALLSEAAKLLPAPSA